MKKYLGKGVYGAVAIGKISVFKKCDAAVTRIHVEDTEKEKQREKAAKFSDKIMLTLAEKKMLAPTVIRSWIIGNIIGILPGAGASIACFMGYNNAKQFSKHKEDFGHGAIEGVCGSEAANNAVTGGTLIPTLTLGVPGNATTAVLLSGLTIHGLTPGYGLFTTEKQITYPFICALFIANLMMVLIGMFGAKHFAKVTLTPKNMLSAFVLSLSIMGTYAVRGNLRDVVVMLVFGVIGYILKLYKYNVVPIVLGLILGPIAEAGLSQALLLNSNSLSATLGTLFVRPICVVLMILMVISVCAPFIMEARKGKQSK